MGFEEAVIGKKRTGHFWAFSVNGKIRRKYVCFDRGVKADERKNCASNEV